MQKHDFTKTMRNVNVGETESRGQKKKRGVEFHNLEVAVSAGDKAIMQKFMSHELSFFNILVDGLGTRARGFPQHLLDFTDQWQKLFAQVAFEGKSLQAYAKAAPDAELPENYEPFRNLILGTGPDGKRLLTERFINIIDFATGVGNIHPLVRKNMAGEILKFYREQAYRALQPVPLGEEENVYKTAPETLGVADKDQKRHLQIPKSLCKITWNPTTETTSIRIPYARNPLVVSQINLVEESDWNYLIVHQEAGSQPRPNTPWVIEVKTVFGGYMTKYLDVKNLREGRIFNIGKRRDFT